MTGMIIVLTLLCPLLIAAGLAQGVARAALWRLLPLAPFPALALAVLSADGAMPVLRGDWLILGIELGLDPVARLFLAFTAVLWIAAGAAARHWMRDDPRATAFGICFLLAMTGNLGLILARDALSFYAFFALMSFAAYGLVIHDRGAAARSAARIYIAFVVAGELALFAGLALVAGQAGSIMLADMRGVVPSDMAALLLLAGFGAKLGLVPLHFWLPPAHGAAPVPASAVLSGAMIKAGLYGLMVTLPLGQAALPEPATMLLSVGLVTIFAALLLGVQQQNAKAVLGFSSVSQMGILALGLGAALLAPEAWQAILPVLVFLATHHALAKGALFLGVGAVGVQQTARARALVMVAMLVPALVLAGLPGSSGALGKEALKSALAEGSDTWLPWLVLALSLSGMATTLLMARHLHLIWRTRPKAPAGIPAEAALLPFLTLAALAVALPALWPWLAGVSARPIGLASAGALWPVALGAATAAIVAVNSHAQRVGPAALAAELAAPAMRLRDDIVSRIAAWRRGMRRLSLRLPRRIAQRGTDWRLAQTAILALIALVMALHLTAPGQGTASPAAPAAHVSENHP